MDRQRDAVVQLEGLADFEPARPQPDPRGWEVLASDGRRIGRVNDVVEHREDREIQYLDVDLDAEFRDQDRQYGRMLIPTAFARMVEEEARVRLEGLRSGEIARRKAPRPRTGIQPLVARERAIVDREMDDPRPS